MFGQLSVAREGLWGFTRGGWVHAPPPGGGLRRGGGGFKVEGEGASKGAGPVTWPGGGGRQVEGRRGGFVEHVPFRSPPFEAPPPPLQP